MAVKNKLIKELSEIYSEIQNEIKSRLIEFKNVWENGSEDEIFVELIFCILTPQSKAKSCWLAVSNLIKKKLLMKANKHRISKELIGKVRFHNQKAERIINARMFFSINGEIFIKSKISQFNDIFSARDWIVENVKGIGYKESSHFLRNIGSGENIAILDRHILRNLESLGIIQKIPKSISKKKYFEIEEDMRKFSKKVKIPLSHLDIVMWYKETGEIFK